MTWRIPLVKGRFATLLSAYSPTLDAVNNIKDAFYESLDAARSKIPDSDKLILMGNFNVRVGTDAKIWKPVIGSHGIRKTNSHSLRLLTLCYEPQLLITNTIFQIKKKYITSWMHPSYGSKHPHKKQKPSKRLIRKALASPDCISHLRNTLAKQLATLVDYNNVPNMENEWAKLRSIIYDAASETVSFTQERHQDWFDKPSTKPMLPFFPTLTLHRSLQSHPR
ncbi:LOW QUALITY PROTEIN: uncharacterized protein LOC117545945 [Xyrichtys novacula]|uniref:LOW QUALITY PROTEIN: uncharacterized protein LOC117545945 n=1 Tax=Xyrichtys novacula TaxID=13765 RepID=A0AAV1FPR3_XYRNO|nr:LOW QUALITY PROTEIN: uncharacterized protein LOC117545945 [Xyrichtys novacula]